MHGGLIQLIAYGPQDVYCRGNLTHSTDVQWGYYSNGTKANNKNGRNGNKIKKQKDKKTLPKPNCTTYNKYKWNAVNTQKSTYVYEKDNTEQIILLRNEHDLDAINFKIDGKCCECGHDLITEHMEAFLFYEFRGVYSQLPCEYIHFACKKSARMKTIIDIEPAYYKLNLNNNNENENDEEEEEEFYIEI